MFPFRRFFKVEVPTCPFAIGLDTVPDVVWLAYRISVSCMAPSYPTDTGPSHRYLATTQKAMEQNYGTVSCFANVNAKPMIARSFGRYPRLNGMRDFTDKFQSCETR